MIYSFDGLHVQIFILENILGAITLLGKWPIMLVLAKKKRKKRWGKS